MVLRPSPLRSRDVQELVAALIAMSGVALFVVLLGRSDGGALPLGLAVGVALVVGHFALPLLLLAHRYRRDPDHIQLTSESLTISSGRWLADPLTLTWSQVAAVDVEIEVTDRHNHRQPGDTVALFATAWRRRVARIELTEPVVVRGHRWPWYRLYFRQVLPPVYGPPLRGTRTTTTLRLALDKRADATAFAAGADEHLSGPASAHESGDGPPGGATPSARLMERDDTKGWALRASGQPWEEHHPRRTLRDSVHTQALGVRPTREAAMATNGEDTPEEKSGDGDGTKDGPAPTTSTPKKGSPGPTTSSPRKPED